MSYATLEEQIHALPTECLDDVANDIEFLLYKKQHAQPKTQPDDLTKFFGCLKELPDGLALQRGMRG